MIQYYESIGLAPKTLKTIKSKDNMLLSRPYSLLQLWLNAMFATSLDVKKPSDVQDAIKNRCVKGVRLIKMTPTNFDRIDNDAFS